METAFCSEPYPSWSHGFQICLDLMFYYQHLTAESNCLRISPEFTNILDILVILLSSISNLTTYFCFFFLFLSYCLQNILDREPFIRNTKDRSTTYIINLILLPSYLEVGLVFYNPLNSWSCLFVHMINEEKLPIKFQNYVTVCSRSLCQTWQHPQKYVFANCLSSFSSPS